MRRFSILALFCLSALSGLHAAPPPPNIVFILSDDHSYPFLGCYGRPEMKTPNFDQFAAEGMKFHRMFTGAPQCVPSRATFLTGRSPVACRITRFSSPLPRDEITYPEILKKEAGYFVGVLGRSYHLDGSGRSPEASARVFEANQLQTFKERFDYVDSTGQTTIPETMKAFFDQRPKDKPYYLWVNFSDPHHPWDTGTNAPDPAKLAVPGSLPDLPGVRADLSRYEGEIEHMDTDFKRVLDIVKDRAGLENTFIVFTGDNGMAFPSGKGSLHDPGLNVPLIVWWPGVIQPGSESRALISGEDVAPTCLEAAGLPVPNRISGKSFLPLLRGQPFQPRQHIFAERGPHGSATFNEGVSAAGVDYSRAVRSDRYKLIYNVTPSHRYSPVDSAGDPSWKDIVKAHEEKQLDSAFETLWFTSPRAVYELYDLEADPSELRNLAGQPDMKDIEQQLKEALQEKMILDYDYLPLPIAGAPKKKASGKNQAAKNDPSREKQFIQKDTDKDGVLSWDEFRQGRSATDAEGWFKARDQDANGSLSREEFITGKVPNPPKK
ncbi:MAG: sulfatase-like hydrolase/transferase [Verrucomicrobiota bacterium]